MKRFTLGKLLASIAVFCVLATLIVMRQQNRTLRIHNDDLIKQLEYSEFLLKENNQKITGAADGMRLLSKLAKVKSVDRKIFDYMITERDGLLSCSIYELPELANTRLFHFQQLTQMSDGYWLSPPESKSLLLIIDEKWNVVDFIMHRGYSGRMWGQGGPMEVFFYLPDGTRLSYEVHATGFGLNGSVPADQ